MSMMPSSPGDVIAHMQARAQLAQQMAQNSRALQSGQLALPPGPQPVNIGPISHTPFSDATGMSNPVSGAAQQFTPTMNTGLPAGAPSGASGTASGATGAFDPSMEFGIGGAGAGTGGAGGAVGSAGALGADATDAAGFFARNFPSLVSKEGWAVDGLGGAAKAFGPVAGAAMLSPYAGNAANALANKAGLTNDNSLPNRFLSGAAAGATIGAGAGLAGGPFAEVTVPIGAGVGAVVGGVADVLKGLFGGKPAAKTAIQLAVESPDAAQSFIQQVGSTAGLQPQYQAQLMQQFNTAMQFSDGSKQSLAAILQGFPAAVNNLAYQQQIAGQVPQNQAQSIQRALALQSMVGSMMNPVADQQYQSGMANAAQIDQLAKTVGGDSGTMLQAQAAAQRAAASKDSADLKGLGAALPTVQAMAMDSQLANQYYQQQQAAQAAAQQQFYLGK